MEADGNAETETSGPRTRETNFVRIWLSTKLTRQAVSGKRKQNRTGFGQGIKNEGMKEIDRPADKPTNRQTDRGDRLSGTRNRQKQKHWN